MDTNIYHLDAILTEIEAVTARTERVEREKLILRGRLREARRQNRALRKAQALAETRARNARAITFAAVGLAVALTCLLHSLILAGGGF